MAAFGTTFSARAGGTRSGPAAHGEASGRAETLQRLDSLAQLLDGAFAIPGTNVRFGLDAVIGLVPGIGDLVTTALSSYIIWEARRLGLPRWKIARMIGNVALDAAVGVVPLVGDLVDAAFKANRRNLRIIRDHFRGEPGGATFGPSRPGPGVIDAEYRVVEPRR